MPLSIEDVKIACSILKQVNPDALNVLTEPVDGQLDVMFRNCIITIHTTGQKGVYEKVFTDVQYMQETQKIKFEALSNQLQGAYMQELEQEITRFGFR